MNKKQLETNIKEIIGLYNNLQSSLHDLLKGVEEENEYTTHLDDFLNFIGLEKNKETRFIAYHRIVSLREDTLDLYLDKAGFSFIEKNKILDKAYSFTSTFHSEIQAVIISVIEAKNLLTPFYLEVFKGVANVGLAFNDFFIPWKNHIINHINKDLENKFENDSDKIMDYLNENDLFDKGHNKNIADRSYSALVFENGNYKSKSYLDVFPKEVESIVEELKSFIIKLSSLEDEIYNSKDSYINYLKVIKEAFLEKDVNSLVEKWSKVDEAWMDIKTPFQIGHPLEYYEDKYRKAVAPEWDLRLQNDIFESVVSENILSMYEEIYDEIGREKYECSYRYSLSNFKRVQLYLSSPVLYYGSELNGLFSAQVVPNDEQVTNLFGKKIFAFPEMVLENKKSSPFMELDRIIFDEKFLYNYRKYLFGDKDIFYKVYDIDTIGHEFGHTLWLEGDSEVIMNKKTGVYKNIEEFKATSGGLAMYFLNDEKIDLDLKEYIFLDSLTRAIGLMKYRKVGEIEPYYCEGIISLEIFFESGILSFKDNKIKFNFSDKIYEKTKEIYLTHYKKLINIYLNKIDAGEFLKDYTIKQNGYYLPKDEKVREFVEYYYDLYEKIGNEIDEVNLKDKYKK